MVLKGEDMKELKTVGDAIDLIVERAASEPAGKTQGRHHRPRCRHAARGRRRARCTSAGPRACAGSPTARAPAASSTPKEHLSVKEARRLDRFAQFAWSPSGEALAQAGWDGGAAVRPAADRLRDRHRDRRHRHGRDPARRDARHAAPRWSRRCGIPQYMPNAGAAAVSMRHGLQGQSYGVVSACASGAHAIGSALRMIQYGDADAVVAGGAEATLTDVRLRLLQLDAGAVADRHLAARSTPAATAS